jgi:hypothetical protein
MFKRRWTRPYLTLLMWLIYLIVLIVPGAWVLLLFVWWRRHPKGIRQQGTRLRIPPS